MNENPYRYQTPGQHYVGDLPRRVIEGMLDRGEHFGIVGGRRCGKTSIIKVLEKCLLIEDVKRPVVPVAIYVTAFDQVSPGVLFRRILEELTARLLDYRWDTFGRETEPYRSFMRNLEERVEKDLTNHYGSEWIAAILVDEIDDLANRLHKAKYGDVFFGNLRHLVMTHKLHDHFRLVVTGVNDPEGVINSGSPLNILAKQELGILKEEDVDKLVRIGFEHNLPNQAKVRLTELTGRHPYLLQGVLQKLWRSDSVGINCVEVDRTAATFESEHDDFSRWFNVFDDVARMVYGYLSANSTHSVSFSRLSAVFGREKSLVSGKEIDDALSVLATHGVIEADGEKYCISGTMFRDWFHSHAPVAKGEVLKILDRLEALVKEQELGVEERYILNENLKEMRKLFRESALGNPGELREKGSEYFKGIYEIVKKSTEFSEIVTKLVSIFGKAASWFTFL